MRFNSKIVLLFFFLPFLLYPQVKEIESLKHSFVSVYKAIIDNNISDVEMNSIVDSLFSDSVKSDKNIIKRIEGYIRNLSSLEEKEYTVIEGDCLWTIAEKFTGDPFNWNMIYETNDTQIKNPNLIFPDQKIKILSVSKAITPDSTVSMVLAALLISEKDSLVQPEENGSDAYENLEIENFIVDETLSKLGRDYFDLFYTQWETQVAGALNYSIVISEKTLPQRGTQISIKVNDLDVYQSFIQPRYELIEQSVNEGVYMVFSYLQNYESIQKELEKGDMKGTGIY